jgi:hypothetical protein
VLRNEDLLGTWTLASVSSVSRSGERSDAPYGARPRGLLTYSADGRVTALISYDGRKPLSIGGGMLEEQAEAFQTFLAYAGRYTINGDQVAHHVEISSIQNYVDKELLRTVKFVGDRMILITPPTRMNGKIQSLELAWQKLSIEP